MVNDAVWERQGYLMLETIAIVFFVATLGLIVGRAGEGDQKPPPKGKEPYRIRPL